MRLENVKELIVKRITNYSYLLLGEPGIGKSTIVKEAAKELANKMNKEFIEFKIEKNGKMKSYEDMKLLLENPDKYFVFVDIRLSSIEPADLQGIPDLEKEYFTYKAPAWARVLSECAGLLFLDEITACNRDDVLSAAFQLVLDRRSGECSFNDDVIIVAAGNDPRESSVARELPAPLTNRFSIFTIDCPTVEEWTKYITSKYTSEEFDMYLPGYLLQDKGMFRKIPEKSSTLEQYPTPRTWEQLGLALVKLGNVNKRVKEEVIRSFVGGDAATRYYSFIALEEKIKIDELLKHPEKITELNMSERLMVMLLMANKIKSQKSLKSVDKFIQPLHEMLSRITFDGEIKNMEYLWYFIYNINTKKQWRVEILNKLVAYDTRYRDLVAEVLKHIFATRRD